MLEGGCHHQLCYSLVRVSQLQIRQNGASGGFREYTKIFRSATWLYYVTRRIQDIIIFEFVPSSIIITVQISTEYRTWRFTAAMRRNFRTFRRHVSKHLRYNSTSQHRIHSSEPMLWMYDIWNGWLPRCEESTLVRCPQTNPVNTWRPGFDFSVFPVCHSFCFLMYYLLPNVLMFSHSVYSVLLLRILYSVLLTYYYLRIVRCLRYTDTGYKPNSSW
jgi:hypothetical protein